MEITVLFGPDKFVIPFPTDLFSSLTVEHLASEIEKKVEIPFEKQKLIFKGKCLQDKASLLESYGIKSGSKIMMLGRKNYIEEDNLLKSIDDIDKQVTKLEKTLEDLSKTSQDLENGWLDGSLKHESIGRLGTNLEVNIEKCMKLVHQLDDMQLLENYVAARNKRKMTIDRIMQDLSEADKLFEIINRIKLDCMSKK